MDYFPRSPGYLAGTEMRGCIAVTAPGPSGGEHRNCRPWAGVPVQPLHLTDPDQPPDKPRCLGLPADRR